MSTAIVFPIPTIPVYSRSRLLLLGVALLVLGGSHPVFAQGDDEKKETPKEGEPAEKSGDDEKKPEKRPSGFTAEQEKKILELFHATKEEFTDKGLLSLEYDFETENENLLMDWAPKVETTRRRIRWAQRWDEGLMIAEEGTFVQKAIWDDRMKIRVTGVSYAQMDDGHYRVVGIFDEKGRTMIGSNVGEQIVRLNGMKITSGFPGRFPVTAVEQKLDFGIELEAGVLRSTRGAARVLDTSKKPSWTKKFGKGRLGLRWLGRTQMCIHKVEFLGKLDVKWALEALEDR